jgi:hypothetical protein
MTILSAPMLEREKTAQEMLELGDVMARRHSHHVQTRIVRHRSAAEGVLQIANRVQADAIVLWVGTSRAPGEWGKTGQETLRRANCKVIVDKVPLAAQPLHLPTWPSPQRFVPSAQPLGNCYY